jgi:enamine deaminase RidA (YjgF/YER057c/UK114 family)
MHLAVSQATPIVRSVDELFDHAIDSQVPDDSAFEIRCNGRIVGHAVSDGDADYCYLRGILPADVRQPRDVQARSCFEQLESALAQGGMSCHHIVRTWLYLDRLLDWYDVFNGARTSFFRERGILGRVIPASTGIGLSNPYSAALVAGAIAIRPRSDAIKIQAVPSPLQCSAVDYRSAFSRAMEVSRPGAQQLYISGTASIAPDGTSAHRDKPFAQIELTMKVIEALLHSRQMTWSDTTRAIAYFRDTSDVRLFEDWCKRKGLSHLPVVFAHATICRDELLFELELDAATS